MDNNKNSAQVVGAMLIGIVVGAVAGILMAPEKGTKTRRKIMQSAQDATDSIKHSIQDQFNALRSEAEELSGTAKAKADEMSQSVRQKAESMRNSS